jgi:hypothetical protein
VYNQIRRLPHLTLHQLAVSASTTAYLYELAGQQEKAIELLLVSAIADVKTATKETTAIFKLSDYCYRKGDLKNAYTFIKEARENATFYKARQRQIEISHVSSIIEGQKINIIESQRKSLKTYAIIMTLLAGVVIGFAVVSFRQLRQLRKAGRVIFATNRELQERNVELRQLNSGLNEANKIKEEYIGYYFHNNSQYIDKLETLKKRVDALLSSKQYAGVQKLVDSVNIKTERNELLKGFDSVFPAAVPQLHHAVQRPVSGRRPHPPPRRPAANYGAAHLRPYPPGHRRQRANQPDAGLLHQHDLYLQDPGEKPVFAPQ